MSDPENKVPPEKPKSISVGVPLHMTSSQCGDSFVISAVAPGLVLALTIDPKMWPPKVLQAILETLAGAIGSNGEQPADTASTTWAVPPKANA